MSNGIGSLATEFRYRDENGKLECLVVFVFVVCAARLL